MRRGGRRWIGKAGGRGEKEDLQEEYADDDDDEDDDDDDGPCRSRAG